MKMLVKRACYALMWYSAMLSFSFADEPARENPKSVPFRADLQRTGCFSGKGVPQPREVLWRFETPPLGTRPPFDNDRGDILSPVYENGALYVSCFYHYIFRLDAATGREKWRLKVGGALMASPVVADGIVYIGMDMGDGSFYALDSETGQPKWLFKAPDNIQATPLVAGGTVYLPCKDGCLYALEAKTGVTLWKYRGLGGAGCSSPATRDGILYVCGSNMMNAIDLKNGSKVWRFKANGEIFTGPTVSDGKVYCGTDEGYLYALDSKTGKELWKLDTADSIRTSLAACDGVVFFVHQTSLSFSPPRALQAIARARNGRLA